MFCAGIKIEAGDEICLSFIMDDATVKSENREGEEKENRSKGLFITYDDAIF